MYTINLDLDTSLSINLTEKEFKELGIDLEDVNRFHLHSINEDTAIGKKIIEAFDFSDIEPKINSIENAKEVLFEY